MASDLHKFQEVRNVPECAKAAHVYLWSVMRSGPQSPVGVRQEVFDKAESDPDNTIAVGSFAKPWFSCVSCVVRIKSCYKKKEKPRKKKQNKQTNKRKTFTT